MYRAVKSKDSNEVVAIGMDESQGGQSYHDIGIWCEFTFEHMPEIPQEVLDYVNEKDLQGKILFKVVDDAIVVKSLEELGDEQ